MLFRKSECAVLSGERGLESLICRVFNLNFVNGIIGVPSGSIVEQRGEHELGGVHRRNVASIAGILLESEIK